MQGKNFKGEFFFGLKSKYLKKNSHTFFVFILPYYMQKTKWQTNKQRLVKILHNLFVFVCLHHVRNWKALHTNDE